MAVVAFTGNGIVPNAAGKNFVDGKTYAGSTKAALSDQWTAPVDPFKARLDALRKMELEAQAEAKRLAQQRANRPLELFGAPLSGPLGGVVSDSLKGVYSAAGAVGSFLTSDAPTKIIPFDPLDLEGKSSPNLNNNFQKSYPKNKSFYEDQGINSQPVLDGNGNIIGYTPTGMKPNNIDSTPATGLTKLDVNADTNFNPNVPQGGASADALARAAGESVVDVLAGNILKDSSFRNKLGNVRNQIYGTPKEEILPNGELRLVYDNELLLYHGITSDMQAAGYVAGRLPDAISPDATDVQKYEYSKSELFAAPLYKIGDEYTQLSTMTRGEKINLQKNLKRSGYYSSSDTLIPGILQGTEIGYLQAAMGEANVAGLELSQLFELRSRARKKAIAGAGGGGGGGGGATTRSVDVSFSTTTMANGRVLLSRVLQDALGRTPSDEELSQFMAMLNGAESKSPTKTITQYINSGSTRKSISRTNPSDVDPTAMAEEFAAGIGGGAPMEAKKETDYLMGYLNSLGGTQ